MGKSRVIMPKALIIDVAAQKRAITNTLNATAKAIKADFGVTTQTWSDKPAFTIESPSPYERDIGTDHEVYTMLNEGTRAHEIRPHGGGVLRFTTPFRSKTVPRQIMSGAGSTGKVEVFTRAVHHPGTKPRAWDEVIFEKWDRQMGAIFQRAIDAEL